MVSFSSPKAPFSPPCTPNQGESQTNLCYRVRPCDTFGIFLAAWLLAGFLNGIGPGMFSQERATSIRAVGWHIVENFIDAAKLYLVAALVVLSFK
jgi:hypothetical protein